VSDFYKRNKLWYYHWKHWKYDVQGKHFIKPNCWNITTEM